MDALNRCSLVVRLSAELQSAIGEAQLQIRKRAGADLVRWTPTHELVFPLVSLGEISVGQVAQVAATVGPIVAQYPSGQVALEGLGGTPNNLQPRSLWIGMSGDLSGLERFAQELECAVMPIVPHHESRPLQSHIPIGRLKQESESTRSALGRAVRVAQIGSMGVLPIREVELIRMASTSTGPTIVTVQAFPLA